MNIKGAQVRVYRHHDFNDVFLYDESHKEDQVVLIAVDPLTIGKDWPEHAQVNGRWFVREHAMVVPSHLAGQAYGMRKYTAIPQVPAISYEPLIIKEAGQCL